MGVAFFSICAEFAMAFTFTSLPLNFNTSVTGCGCGFGFEQKCWWINGLGGKKARIGGFACPYSSPLREIFSTVVGRVGSGGRG